MNSNTTAQSRIPVGYAGWYIQYPEKLVNDEGEFWLYDDNGIGQMVVGFYEGEVKKFAAAMSRPSPKQAPVRSAEVERAVECFEDLDSTAYEMRAAGKVLAATLEAQPPAHPPVNTAQPAPRNEYGLALCPKCQSDNVDCSDVMQDKPYRTWMQVTCHNCQHQGSEFPFDVEADEEFQAARDAKAEWNDMPRAALTQPVNTGPSAPPLGFVEGLIEGDKYIGALWSELFDKDMVNPGASEVFDKWRRQLRERFNGNVVEA